MITSSQNVKIVQWKSSSVIHPHYIAYIMTMKTFSGHKSYSRFFILLLRPYVHCIFQASEERREMIKAKKYKYFFSPVRTELAKDIFPVE